jgi:hypothetical protein
MKEVEDTAKINENLNNSLNVLSEIYRARDTVRISLSGFSIGFNCLLFGVAVINDLINLVLKQLDKKTLKSVSKIIFKDEKKTFANNLKELHQKNIIIDKKMRIFRKNNFI